MTGTECFAHFGIKPKNVQWSWSGRSDDGKTVAVRLWKDLFYEGGKRYRIQNIDPAYDYDRQLGLAELMVNLQHAIDHCDGVVRVIVIVARDKDASPRSIKEGFPQDKLLMRVSNLDVSTGTADLERIG